MGQDPFWGHTNTRSNNKEFSRCGVIPGICSDHTDTHIHKHTHAHKLPVVMLEHRKIIFEKKSSSLLSHTYCFFRRLHFLTFLYFSSAPILYNIWFNPFIRRLLFTFYVSIFFLILLLVPFILFFLPRFYHNPSTAFNIILPDLKVFFAINRLTPNDPYMGRTAPLTSKLCILYIY